VQSASAFDHSENSDDFGGLLAETQIEWTLMTMRISAPDELPDAVAAVEPVTEAVTQAQF